MHALKTCIFAVLFVHTVVYAAGDPISCGLKFESANGSNWSGKTLIFDTNVLLNDPMAMYHFPGAQIILTGTVMEELDGKKSDEQLGRAARSFSREVIQLIQKNPGAKILPLGGKSSLKIDHGDYTSQLSHTNLDPKKKDNEILALALNYSAQLGAGNVVLITDDVNVRIKAFGLDVQTRPFELDWATPKVEQEELVRSHVLSDSQLNDFLKDGKLPLPTELKIAPNEFVMLKSPGHAPGPETVARYRYNREKPEESALTQLPSFPATPTRPGAPLNLEQAMALDLLLDPTIDAVIMEAKAGTGKTFLAMLTAMALKNTVQKIYISRPTVYVGRNNPGALPGDITQKYSEWTKPFLDNCNMLMKNRTELPTQPGANSRPGRSFNPSPDLPQEYEILPFEFMRGRSIADSLILIDEFQNTNIHEAKTILTRVGKNTKIIIMGDPSQIDAGGTQLNVTNNGLSFSVDAYTNPALTPEERSHVGVVKLVNGVRSPFAELSAKVFSQPITH